MRWWGWLLQLIIVLLLNESINVSLIEARTDGHSQTAYRLEWITVPLLGYLIVLSWGMLIIIIREIWRLMERLTTKVFR
jgi:hypothetical protein